MRQFNANLVLLILFSLCINIVRCDLFNLTILHNNDFHSHFSPMNEDGTQCNEHSSHRKCFGGVPRTVYKIKELREVLPNVIALNSGDHFAGTIWYTLYKWRIVVEFVKLIGYEAMSLGNHEFDDGVDGLAPYLDATAPYVPTLCCNLDVSKEPKLKSIRKSKVFVINGHEVGVIGYLTPETSFLSRTGKTVKLTDEIECIRTEANRLKARGVKIIIAVGHSGYNKDLEIAQQVADLDIVVGGHSNTFLYTGKAPSIEKPIDNYPVVVNHNDDRKTLVVTAYAFGKYLGFLNVSFDADGNIVQYKGNPILLDESVPQDSETRSLLVKREKEIEAKFKTKIGETAVYLDGDSQSCRRFECNLGNLITDAFVNSALSRDRVKSENSGWTEFPMAITNSGSIRSSMSETLNDGEITTLDILNVMTFHNNINAVEISGSKLINLLEQSVSKYSTSGADVGGEFLQVSGIKVVYDISKPIGNRVKSVQVRCGPTCRVPKYEQINPEKEYRLLVPAYIERGGNNYTIFREKNVKHISIGFMDVDAVSEYFKTHKPIVTEVEGRITFESSLSNEASISASKCMGQVRIMLSFVIILKFIL
ncbi:nucleotidase-like protein [Dinothrombium tinctorium]|uniref:5'-nucleotidase n=1 Tax=Dinothrombium tinctorium TaxID=1965070 RepID=A0A3S3P2N2_9ACAR|nr:nucleotidase-like protein [Dinothrombium tinctorium]RWS10146.1 nucleotidase-like protein [Dinothrombium tinctorium]RWS10716.1 nucleotidase-like protein [Dinothrombium tinctorium]RWS10897.1 nucleotidase-like protein [Dinothrombium tinctorium]